MHMTNPNQADVHVRERMAQLRADAERERSVAATSPAEPANSRLLVLASRCWGGRAEADPSGRAAPTRRPYCSAFSPGAQAEWEAVCQ